MSRFCPMVFQPEHLWPVPAADKLSRNLGRLVSGRESGRRPPERHLRVGSEREGGVMRTLIGTSWIAWPVVTLSLATHALLGAELSNSPHTVVSMDESSAQRMTSGATRQRGNKTAQVTSSLRSCCRPSGT